MSRGHPFDVQGKKWGNMAWEKDPKRVAINQHLHRMHGGFAATGDTLNRNIQHDELHFGEGAWAGNPVHRHIDGELDQVELLEGKE